MRSSTSETGLNVRRNEQLDRHNVQLIPHRINCRLHIVPTVLTAIDMTKIYFVLKHQNGGCDAWHAHAISTVCKRNTKFYSYNRNVTWSELVIAFRVLGSQPT